MFFQLPKLLGARAPPPPPPPLPLLRTWVFLVQESKGNNCFQAFDSSGVVTTNSDNKKMELGNNNRPLCNEAIHVCKYV